MLTDLTDSWLNFLLHNTVETPPTILQCNIKEKYYQNDIVVFSLWARVVDVGWYNENK